MVARCVCQVLKIKLFDIKQNRCVVLGLFSLHSTAGPLSGTIDLIMKMRTIPVARSTLISKLSLFANDYSLVTSSTYKLKSRVKISSFKTFIDAVNDKDYKITADNANDLVTLCDELGFNSLKSEASLSSDSKKSKRHSEQSQIAFRASAAII